MGAAQWVAIATLKGHASVVASRKTACSFAYITGRSWEPCRIGHLILEGSRSAENVANSTAFIASQ